MNYNQQNSVFMPGLTARGPVYSGNSTMFGALALPTVSPVVKYGLMAGLLYLGAKKKLPFGLTGGIAAALAVYQFLPATSAAQGSGAPTSADISASTAGVSTVDVGIIDPGAVPVVNIPALSGMGEYLRAP